jgi:hypothetical protein
MFKLAVLGPIVTGGFGLARQCALCRAGRPGERIPACHGFDAGCLGYGPGTPAASAGDYVRFDTKRFARRGPA